MSEQAQRKVLVVDDEEVILDLLRYNLENEGYLVETVNDGRRAVEVAMDFVPDIILLDIMMPEQDGVETCRQLRAVPELAGAMVLFLTARSEEYSEVAAFDVGADDYITKPIKPRALLSRIAALFRRDHRRSERGNKIVFGDLIIDKAGFNVKYRDKEISLPKKEFELLYFLAQNPEKVYGRDELLASIWGTDVYVLSRTVDVHIRKIREKIRDDIILTVKGVGYKFSKGQ